MTELQPCTQHCTPHRSTPHPQEQGWRGCASSGTGLALHLAVTRGPSRILAADTVGTHSSRPWLGGACRSPQDVPPPCSHPAGHTGSHRNPSAGPQGTSLAASRYGPSTRPGPHCLRAQGPEVSPTLSLLQGQQSVLPCVTPASPLALPLPCPCSALHTGRDCSALPHGKRGKSDRREAKLGLWLL